MEKYIMAIDEGTTSTRAILFNHAGEIVSVIHQCIWKIQPFLSIQPLNQIVQYLIALHTPAGLFS